jgi:hypothetical protein
VLKRKSAEPAGADEWEGGDAGAEDSTADPQTAQVGVSVACLVCDTQVASSSSNHILTFVAVLVE